MVHGDSGGKIEREGEGMVHGDSGGKIERERGMKQRETTLIHVL